MTRVPPRNRIGQNSIFEREWPHCKWVESMPRLLTSLMPRGWRQTRLAIERHYGRALAASEATRRSAEYEIKAAIKLEPQNALFRTMLAELYFDLGFPRRAQTEAEQALAIDPSSAPARALLRKLEKSRKVG